MGQLLTLIVASPPLHVCAGKLATDLQGGRIFVADSGNNRVIITDLQGRFQEAVGCGAPGLSDGGYAEAAFNRPQGLAYSAQVTGQDVLKRVCSSDVRILHVVLMPLSFFSMVHVALFPNAHKFLVPSFSFCSATACLWPTPRRMPCVKWTWAGRPSGPWQVGPSGTLTNYHAHMLTRSLIIRLPSQFLPMCPAYITLVRFTAQAMASRAAITAAAAQAPPRC